MIMVKVLANGDIVPDDDPRANGRSNVSSSTADSNRSRQVARQFFSGLGKYYVGPDGAVGAVSQ